MMQSIEMEQGGGCGKGGCHGQQRHGRGQHGHGHGRAWRHGNMGEAGMPFGCRGHGGATTPRAENAATPVFRVRMRCEVDPEVCRGCGACLRSCEAGALRLTTREDGRRFCAVDDVHCTGCGACVADCPTGAARLSATRETEAAARPQG